MCYISELYIAELPPRAVLVYRYLLDRSGSKGACFPSINTIARDISLSRNTVIRAIADLEKSAYIKTEQRWRENGGRSTLRFIILK